MTNNQCIRQLEYYLAYLENRLEQLPKCFADKRSDAMTQYALTKAALIVHREQKLICNDNEL